MHSYYIKNNIIRHYIIQNIKIKKKIIFSVSKRSGMCNNLRGIISTIFLSYLYRINFILNGWSSIIHYFNFPVELIMNDYITVNITFKRFNRNIYSLLEKENIIINIVDIYGYVDILLNNKNKYKEIIQFKKLYNKNKITSKDVHSIIYKEFFSPSNRVLFYLNLFNKNRNKRDVVGIHIRSGLFSHYRENYFQNVDINFFYKTAREAMNNYSISYVFPISDNIHFLNAVKYYFKKSIINIQFKGKIIHSKFSLYKNNVNNDSLRIVSEFIILSSCNFIIGTMKSSFSTEACYRQNKRCILLGNNKIYNI